MTESSGISSTYSNILSSSNPIFVRPKSNIANYYYYYAIQVTIYMDGTYIFSSNSSLDTYGCVYRSSFDAQSPSQNLIAFDDDGAGNGQFQISLNLSSYGVYVLVVTTYSSSVTGNFSIKTVGPTPVSLTSITQVTSE